jgi:hypothetical protein
MAPQQVKPYNEAENLNATTPSLYEAETKLHEIYQKSPIVQKNGYIT